MAAALALVGRIRGADPTHPRAHFAAAQLHAELKQWPEAEAAYAAAAASETDLAQCARAWFGVGDLPHRFCEKLRPFFFEDVVRDPDLERWHS